MIDDRYIWISPADIGDRLDGRYNSASVVEARSKLKEYGNICPLNTVVKKISCGPFGSTLTADEHDPRGAVALVQPTDISEPLFAQEPGWRISTQTANDKSLDLYPAETLLFARVGIYPHSGVLPERIKRATISSSMIAAVLDHNVADPFFLHAFFQSSLGRHILFGIQKITAQPTISTEELAKVLVPEPSFEIQRAIGNKIRKAERLRELAEACYQTVSNEFAVLLPKNHSQDQHKSSFIRATDVSTGRLDAKFYAPQHLANRQRIALIAKTCKLHDFVHSVSNGCEVRDFKESGLRYLVVGNIDKGKLHINNAPFISKSSDIPQKAIIQEGDVLVVRTGSIGQAAAVLNEDVKDKTVISSHFIKLSLNKSEDATYLSSFLNSFAGKMLQEQISYGAVQQQISQDELLELPIPIFDKTKEHYIAQNHLSWRRYQGQSEQLVSESKQDIEALIDGTLDQDALINEGTQLETWLREHPSPNTGETHHA